MVELLLLTGVGRLLEVVDDVGTLVADVPADRVGDVVGDPDDALPVGPVLERGVALRSMLIADVPLLEVDAVDDAGRRPLFATVHGRTTTSTLRDTCYYATHPCRAGPCPHERERPTCEHHSRTSAHGCPSARSPHEIRSGSITWQLHRGLSKDVVADRVNATIRVIERHYDQAQQLEEFRQRRAEHLDKLGIDDSDDEETA